MPLTIPQYVDAMAVRQEVLAQKLGLSLSSLPREARTILICSNAMTAVCFRAFTQLGLVTDAQLAQAFDDAMNSVFPPVGDPSLPEKPV